MNKFLPNISLNTLQDLLIYRAVRATRPTLVLAQDALDQDVIPPATLPPANGVLPVFTLVMTVFDLPLSYRSGFDRISALLEQFRGNTNSRSEFNEMRVIINLINYNTTSLFLAEIIPNNRFT